MTKSLKDLKADLSFPGTVSIPRPGKDPVDVAFTFKHRRRADFSEWIKSLAGKDKIVAVMECAVGWELSDPFNQESVSELNEDYMGAADAIIDKYIEELTNARLGN